MQASVVIRAYRRQAALKELLGRLRQQQQAEFEVVVLEQSDDPQLVSEIAAWGDPRIRVVVSSPLNPPAARNEAIRHCRGEVLLFIDDDDLPLSDDWIALHLRNYEDPDCMGVVGRLVPKAEADSGPRFPRLVRLLAMRQTFFKDTVMLANNTLRKDDIDFLIGSNASVRRALVDRIGAWDEGVPMNEEQSFAIKFHRARRGRERFVFDPAPVVWRRTDIPGGLNRRAEGDWHLRELEARLFYYRKVVGHYYPWRYRLCYPLFCLRGLEQVMVWIWDPDNRHHPFSERVRKSLELVTKLPSSLRSNRYSADRVIRVPSLK